MVASTKGRIWIFYVFMLRDLRLYKWLSMIVHPFCSPKIGRYLCLERSFFFLASFLVKRLNRGFGR